MAKFCSECGKPVNHDWIVCPYCSNSIYQGTEIVSEQKSEHKTEKIPEISEVRMKGFDSLPSEETEKRVTKTQQKAILIGIIVIIAAIAIPAVTLSILNYGANNNLRKKVDFYVNNGLSSASYTISIPPSNLDYYNEQPHPHHNYIDEYYVATIVESYCTPNNSDIINTAQAIRGKCTDQSDSEEVINALLSFTQAIGYKAEDTDLCKYPLETIFYQGDCEDLSVLFGSLVVALGFDSIIIIIAFYDEVDDEWGGHVCIGVYLDFVPSAHPSSSSYYFDVDSKEYWICETTVQGWMIGELPVSSTSFFLMAGYDYIL